MAYVDAGPSDARETLLLLHGEPMWGYLYRKMIGPLVEAGYRVIVPDLIGFGRSDKFIDPERYTYSGHVTWVSALIDKLDLKQMTIFGQDWGSLIGGRVLAESIDRFARAGRRLLSARAARRPELRILELGDHPPADLPEGEDLGFAQPGSIQADGRRPQAGFQRGHIKIATGDPLCVRRRQGQQDPALGPIQIDRDQALLPGQAGNSLERWRGGRR